MPPPSCPPPLKMSFKPCPPRSAGGRDDDAGERDENVVQEVEEDVADGDDDDGDDADAYHTQEVEENEADALEVPPYLPEPPWPRRVVQG